MYNYDLIGNDKFQSVKITQGGVGNDDGYVSSSKPLSVSSPAPQKSSIFVLTASPYSYAVILENPNRKGMSILNETDSDMFILFGNGVASDAHYSLVLKSNNLLKLGAHDYSGQINACNAGTGLVRVTEFKWK